MVHFAFVKVLNVFTQDQERLQEEGGDSGLLSNY